MYTLWIIRALGKGLSFLEAYKASTSRTVIIKAINNNDDGYNTVSNRGSAGYTSEIKRLEQGLGLRE